jgi:hypothetical protein
MLRAVLALAPEVPAPPAEPRLEWVAPPSCPDAARGGEHLVRFLGGRALSAPARVELRAGATGHVALVTVDGATRTLHASDCETLARAAALVVAVSLDPVTAAEAVLGREAQGEPLLVPAPAPAPGVAGEGQAGPPVGEDAAPAPARASPPPTRPRRAPGAPRGADMPPRTGPSMTAARDGHALGLGGGVALALVPALTGALRLGYAYDRGALRVQADVTYATPRRVTYPAEPGVGGRFQSVALGGRACFAASAPRVVVPLCGGVEGGPIFGRGRGVTNPRSPVGAWVGALAGGAVVVRLVPRLALTAGADLLVALRRPAFHVGTRETLFRVPPVGLRALAGLELRLR